MGLASRLAVGGDREGDDQEADEARREEVPPEEPGGTESDVGPALHGQRQSAERGGLTPGNADSGGEHESGEPAGDRPRRGVRRERHGTVDVSLKQRAA